MPENAAPEVAPVAQPALLNVAMSGTQIGAKLWSMANTLRSAGVRPADYQAFILPLLMYKVVCDRNVEARDLYVAEHGDEDWDVWKDEVVPFAVPTGMDFDTVSATATNVGEAMAKALLAITEANQDTLGGVFLDTDYGKLSDQAMNDLCATLNEVSFNVTETSQDAIGAAYEYLLGKFADAAGAKAGQFFTPICVAQLLTRIVDPQPGDSVYDPTCGSAGLLSTAAEQVAAAGHERTEVALFGQELDEQSFAIARINMFLHGNAGEILRGDTLLDPQFHSDDALKTFSAIVANPPFGLENSAVAVWPQDKWGRNRWGNTTKKGSELAFVAHIASSMDGVGDENGTGRAAVVLPMGALFRGGAEAGIREALLKAGLVDAVVALPPNLFFNTSIPASVLVLRAVSRHPGQVLFVDASTQFNKVGKQNVLGTEHVNAIFTAVTTGEPSDGVRTYKVAVTAIVEADSALTTTRWMPSAEADVVDVRASLQLLQESEAAAAAAGVAFWASLQGAGYDV